MSEASMRANLRRKLKDLDWRAVENRVGKGTPDNNYVEGWCELKWLRHWPAKGGVVAISHYTNQQRLWLRRRWRKGGRVFLMLVQNQEMLLWAGCDAGPVGYLTREELYSTCLWRSAHWAREVDELKRIITLPRAGLEMIREERGLCNLPLLNNFSYNDVGLEKTNTLLQDDGD